MNDLQYMPLQPVQQFPDFPMSPTWKADWRRGGIPGLVGNAIGDFGRGLGYGFGLVGEGVRPAGEAISYAWQGPEQYSATRDAVTPIRDVDATRASRSGAQAPAVQAPGVMPVAPTNPVLVDSPTTGNNGGVPATAPLNTFQQKAQQVGNSVNQTLGAMGIGQDTDPEWKNAFMRVTDPNVALQEQLDPEYMQKNWQNREWSADYEVSKAQEKFDTANRRAEWVAKTFGNDPARMGQAMTYLQSAHEHLKMAHENRSGIMALNAAEQGAQFDRTIKREEFAAGIKEAQAKAGQGSSEDLNQYYQMAFNALKAAGIDEERAKDMAPAIIQKTANGINFSPEMVKNFMSLTDKESASVANAIANLEGNMTNDPNYLAYKQSYIDKNMPQTEFDIQIQQMTAQIQKAILQQMKDRNTSAQKASQ